MVIAGTLDAVSRTEGYCHCMFTALDALPAERDTQVAPGLVERASSHSSPNLRTGLPQIDT
jgi:hypothetical protein